MFYYSDFWHTFSLFRPNTTTLYLMIPCKGELRNGKKYAELEYLLPISGNSGVQKRASKASSFNYIVWLEGSLYVISAVLCVCGLSYSPSCRRRVLTHLQRQDARANIHEFVSDNMNATATTPFLWHVWNLYEYPHMKDRKHKLWE